ncbi:AAA family ATPase [Paenibacillus maysiensis]|nr:AAA family ATPase [Paenibacillus maysiensis]
MERGKALGKVIALANQKYGVGKTITAFNPGAGPTGAGKKVFAGGWDA